MGTITLSYRSTKSGIGGSMGEATSFDHIVAILGLGPDQYKDSLPLKEWVRQNKDEKYVPTDLLKHWGFQDDEAA
jgi:hypothetical protein